MEGDAAGPVGKSRPGSSRWTVVGKIDDEARRREHSQYRYGQPSQQGPGPCREERAQRQPRFVKQYADLRGQIAAATRECLAEVADGKYPDHEHSYDWAIR
jgi:hypothetical protein